MVAPNGLAFLLVRNFRGWSPTELYFDHYFQNFSTFAVKVSKETNINDKDVDESSWDMVFDKGHAKLGDAVWSIISQKISRRPPCSSLKKKNTNISSDRTIAENWVGRFVIFWGLFYK